MSKREPSHAGSWYSSDNLMLNEQLDSWLTDNNNNSGISCESSLIKATIVPHAGYKYSGKVSASAYSLLAGLRPKKVIILGPSHFQILSNTCGVSQFSSVGTPLGNIQLDNKAASFLTDKKANAFVPISSEDDLMEHSLEMQFPFIYKLFSECLESIFPLKIGHFTNNEIRKDAAESLINYFPSLATDEVLFVISSDFCHYGKRFNYMPSLGKIDNSLNKCVENLDKEGFNTLNSSTDPGQAFSDYLFRTGNTICGSEPINFFLEIVKLLKIKGTWKLIDYAQSNEITATNSNSVSYLAAVFERSKQN